MEKPFSGASSTSAEGTKKGFHLEQLGEGTIEHLLELDLANKPEAQEPLLQFLMAMGVSREQIKGSAVLKSIANKEAYIKLIEKNGVKGMVDSTGI